VSSVVSLANGSWKSGMLSTGSVMVTGSSKREVQTTLSDLH
jgi:hypothetical protein